MCIASPTTDEPYSGAASRWVWQMFCVLSPLAIGGASAGCRRAGQKATHMTLTVNRVANNSANADWYRVGAPVETRTFEIAQSARAGADRSCILPFRFQEMSDLMAGLYPDDQAGPTPPKYALTKNGIGAQIQSICRPAHSPRLIEHVLALLSQG